MKLEPGPEPEEQKQEMLRMETSGVSGGICTSGTGAVYLGIRRIEFPPDPAHFRAKRVPEKG